MSKPPKRFRAFIEQHDALGEAYQQLGRAATEAGPLEKKTTELVRLGMSIGMQHEGAVHAHARRALDAGATPDELRHAVLLGTTTLGFPSMMAAYTWVEDVLDAPKLED